MPWGEVTAQCRTARSDSQPATGASPLLPSRRLVLVPALKQGAPSPLLACPSAAACCYAFAAVAAIESYYLLSGQGNNNTLDLAEQEIVSCYPGNPGCTGGGNTAVVRGLAASPASRSKILDGTFDAEAAQQASRRTLPALWLPSPSPAFSGPGNAICRDLLPSLRQ